MYLFSSRLYYFVLNTCLPIVFAFLSSVLTNQFALLRSVNDSPFGWHIEELFLRFSSIERSILHMFQSSVLSFNSDTNALHASLYRRSVTVLASCLSHCSAALVCLQGSDCHFFHPSAWRRNTSDVSAHHHRVRRGFLLS